MIILGLFLETAVSALDHVYALVFPAKYRISRQIFTFFPVTMGDLVSERGDPTF